MEQIIYFYRSAQKYVPIK